MAPAPCLRRFVVLAATPLVLLGAACGDDSSPSAAARSQCEPYREASFGDEHDEGPCALETGSADGQSWALIGNWDEKPPEGSSGNGPCVDLQLSTGAGAGWCDLPEARLIGEWIERDLTPTTNVAWGPTAAGRVAEVRIEFASGDPIAVRPKPTPWTEFDYWFASYLSTRRPLALVALDGQGKQLAREDLSGGPPPSIPTPTHSPTTTPSPY